MGKTRTHFVWIEWLRAISCSAVVLLHVWDGVIRTDATDAGGGAVQVVGAGRLSVWLLIQTALTRFAVPCFLMLTGYLVLTNPCNRHWHRVGHYAIKALLALALFGLPYCIIERYMSVRTVSSQLFVDSFYNLLCGKSWSHMWYVYALLGIYFLLPAIAFVAQTVEIDTLSYLIGVLWVGTLVVPTVNSVLGLAVDPVIPVAGSSLFYVLLGGYLRRFDVCLDGRVVLCGTAGLVLTMVLCLIQIVFFSEVPIALTSATSPLVAAYAALVFMYTREKFFDLQPPNIISVLARDSFGIYLIHPVVLNVFYKGMGVSPLNTPSGSSVAFFVVALIISWAAAEVMRRLPIYRSFL